MKWYHYLAAFGAGFFLVNAIPHLVSGVTGQMFPSPFASPPGEGLSPPLINVVWALINMVIGYVLLRFSKVKVDHHGLMIALFLGTTIVSVMLSMHFGAVMSSNQ